MFMYYTQCYYLCLLYRLGATVEIYYDEENYLEKDAFSAYPELISLDATCKLLQLLGLATYIHYILVESKYTYKYLLLFQPIQ